MKQLLHKLLALFGPIVTFDSALPQWNCPVLIEKFDVVQRTPSYAGIRMQLIPIPVTNVR